MDIDKKLIRVKIVGPDEWDDGFHINLPCYEGRQFDTDKGIKPPAAKAIVEVPATFINKQGELDRKFIKATYKGSKWEQHIDEVDDPEVI